MFRFLFIALFMALQSNALILNSAHTMPQHSVVAATSNRVGSAVLMAKKEGKKITILLEKDAEGLGAAGDLVEVKPAYAENFLVARGVGVFASIAVIEQKKAEAEAALEKAIAARKLADKAKETINDKYGKGGMVYEVQVKDGAIDGSVTSDDIAKELDRLGVKVTAADIAMPEVTELGSVIAEVALHPEVSATVKVNVEKSKITFS